MDEDATEMAADMPPSLLESSLLESAACFAMTCSAKASRADKDVTASPKSRMRSCDLSSTFSNRRTRVCMRSKLACSAKMLLVAASHLFINV